MTATGNEKPSRCRDTLRTFRMVAEDPALPVGLVCIDVVLRGNPNDVDVVEPLVKRFLDVGCNLQGSWVDDGTDRESVTFGV